MRVVLAMLIAAMMAGCAQETAEPSDEFGLDDQLEATETTGIIRGVIVDKAITPVAGVQVALDCAEPTTVTDENGLFGFSDVEPGSHMLCVTILGYGDLQSSAYVEAGVQNPPILRIMIEADPSTAPFIEALTFKGHLTCGAAVVYTSVGCTTNPTVAGELGDTSVWSVDFETIPTHAQGELVWENTQIASGNFIWQIVQSEYPGTPQPNIGYMETTPSPALTYLDQEVVTENEEWMLTKGIDYRFFGGPHELCPQHTGDSSVNRFGCGLTIDQGAEAYIHHFYNMDMTPGWRFTSDGDHPLPK
jgi:hypothetical protein